MADQTNAGQEVASEVAATPETKVDISQGVPITAEIPAQPEPRAEETPKEIEEKSVTERLKQKNARQAKLLSTLGIDPMSDLLEQFEEGLITPEMVKQHVLGRQATEPAPAVTNIGSDPLSIAQAEYNAAKAAYDKEAESGSISIQTNNAHLSAIQKLNDAKLEGITQQIAADRTARQANENVEQVLNVARSTPEYSNYSDELKSTADMVNIAVTGIIADKEAKAMGYDPASLSPSQYGYFAKKATTELEKLANYYIEMGRRQAKEGLIPKNTNQITPDPISSGEGGAIPPVDKYKNVTHTNHLSAARQYVKEGRVM